MNNSLVPISAKIAEHLVRQEARALSVSSEGEQVCVYKAEDGKMCAVGCLLGKGYSPEFEGRSATAFNIMTVVGLNNGVDLTPKSACYDEACLLLKSWQSYHDSDLCFKNSGYEAWLQGVEGALSPIQFHYKLLKE